MKIRFCILIFVTAGFFFTNTACSQEITVKDSVRYKTEEIKVVSNRVVTDIFNSPSRIEIISGERIANTNGETLADILKLGSSIFIKSYGPGAALNTISLNGMGAEHTLILLNGFKLSSFQNALLDLVTFSKDEIERIEILNNGSSSLYGSDAMGGVVNIITRSPSEESFGVKLALQMGSYSQKKYSFSVHKNLPGINLNYKQSDERSDNDYDFYVNPLNDFTTQKRINSSYKIKNYSTEGSIKVSDVSKINFYSVYSDVFRKIPGPVSHHWSSSNADQSDRNWFNYLSLESILKNNFKLTSGFNFQNNLMNYFDGGSSSSFYKNYVYSGSTALEKKFRNSNVNSGVEVVYATIKSNELETNAKRFQIGIFTASEINFNKLKVFPSGRFDHISDINKNVFTGKLGGNYKLFKDEEFHLRFSAGNNFAAPTFNALYWNDLGNKDLKPERSLNFDAGAVYGFYFLGNFLLDATYTKIFASEKIVWKPVNSVIWKPVNIGKSESDVFSLSGEYLTKVSSDLLIRVRQSYTHTRSLKKSMDMENDPSFDKQIFYIPEQSFKMEAELKYKDAGVNLFYNFIGKRYTDFENNHFLPGVDILDGNIFFKVINIDKISFLVKLETNNIFNTGYSVIQGYPMPLRNYKLSLNLEY